MSTTGITMECESSSGRMGNGAFFKTVMRYHKMTLQFQIFYILKYFFTSSTRKPFPSPHGTMLSYEDSVRAFTVTKYPTWFTTCTGKFNFDSFCVRSHDIFIQSFTSLCWMDWAEGITLRRTGESKVQPEIHETFLGETISIKIFYSMHFPAKSKTFWTMKISFFWMFRPEIILCGPGS